MSVTSWEQMAGELVTDPAMASLTDEQVTAIVDVLVLIIHADSKVSPVEVAGFNHLFFDLPWLEGRHELVRNHLPRAAEFAAVAGDGDKGRAFAKQAAERLEGTALRERVFEMAASLVAVDMRVAAMENVALTWLAEAFELDSTRRDAILQRSKP